MAVHESLPKPFIVGSSRSGTSLLRSMLNAHPALAIPPETHFIPGVAKACTDVKDPKACFLDGVLTSRNWPIMALDEQTLRERLSALHTFTVGEAIRVVYELYAAQQGKPRWGDKTPMYAAHMGLIQALIPEAHFIHIIRDGRDVSLSALPLMRRNKPEASLEDAARYWVRRVSATRKQSAKIRNYLEVRYETIVLDTETELRSICEFTNLPWEPALLSYHALSPDTHPGANFTGTTTNRVPTRRENQAPDPTRVRRWRERMSREELTRVEAIVGPMLQELGYQLE